jgi:hypothetical protein
VGTDRNAVLRLVTEKYDVRSWIAINMLKWAVMNDILKYSCSLY